ncbi:hypothetical protein B0H10DRAFT_652063 [Mycena sp. CBHHK59/15]|nr:hypothetical protein B0H10DRAFT_652063 [Mycena sp. CBHHK59/15]
MSVDEQDQPPPMTPLQESTQPGSPAHDPTPPPPQPEHAKDPTPPPPQPAPAAQVQPEIRPPVPPPNSSVIDDAPNGLPKLQRIPLPGERRRSRGSVGNSALGVVSQAQVYQAPPPPTQSSLASKDPAPSTTGVEMAVDQPVAGLTALQTLQPVVSMVKTPETIVAPLRKTPEAYYPSPVTPRSAGSSEGTGVEISAECGNGDDAAAVENMKVKDKQNGKAPGCTWFRGHPTNVFKALLEEDHDQSSSGHEEMAVDVDVDEQLAFEKYQVGPFRFNGTVEGDGMDADMGEDMQLLYPDQLPSPSTDRPPSSTRSRSPHERHPSESSSSASSASSSPLRLPSASASSSALFMSAAHDHAAPLPSYQRSPLRPLLAPAVFSAADPGIPALFAQSCNILGDEIRALRAEMGMLRGELGVGKPPASPLQLEHRVRMLEQQSPQRVPPRPQSPWTHPLQHLIAGEDERMDVDKNGETLPIRSHRKQFRNTMRF